MTRPTITENAELAFAPFGAGIKPDGTDKSMRILIEPDGFHFEAYDFDDLILPSLSFESLNNKKYVLSFDNNGSLLVNGNKYTVPTSQGDEIIKGDKNYEGQIRLSGGLQLLSPSGIVFDVTVDDDGKLTTKKEVDNA